MKNSKYFSIALFVVVAISSCKKIINVDLNSAAPQLVVEGSVTDQPGPYLIKLSKSVNFSDDNVFPAFTGAAVTVSDNAGNSETLTETSPGNYTSASLVGTPGRAYTVSITAAGKSYSGISTMPFPVSIDTLIVDTTSHSGFGGGPGGGGGGGGGTSIKVDVLFNDPVGVANYYRLVEVVNGAEQNKIVITSDNLRDGTLIDRTLSFGDDILHHGDSVTVFLQSIDKNVYEYFRTLNQIVSGGGGLQASTPDNPTTNLNNKALGYFSAYAVRSKKIVIP
ncbi:MAG: DUF4249 domain-containing protein [Bacteroidia bacterium]